MLSQAARKALECCRGTLRRTLRRLGWRWRRARRRPAKEPPAHRVAAARKALAKLHQAQAQGRCEVIYADESGFCLQPTLFRCWQHGKATLSLPAKAHSKRLNAAGFLRADGQLNYLAREGRLGAQDFIEAVQTKLLPSLNKRAVLVLDNGPCHRSRLVKERRATWRAQGLRLLFLPPYCPHLNRIETLWRMTKHCWLAPSAYAGFACLRQAVTAVLDAVGHSFHVTFA